MGPEVEDLDSLPSPISNRYPPLNLTAFQYWQLNVRQREAKQAVLDYWRETEGITGTGRPVDAIITPMAPHVAPPHGTNKCVLTKFRGSYSDANLIAEMYLTRSYGASWTVRPVSCPCQKWTLPWTLNGLVIHS